MVPNKNVLSPYKETSLSELIAVAFDDMDGATKALDELNRQQSKEHLELEGAAVLTVDAKKTFGKTFRKTFRKTFWAAGNVREPWAVVPSIFEFQEDSIERRS
jgi:hypothetical protein